MRRSWPLVKRVNDTYLWSVPGSCGARYERDERLERIMISECKHYQTIFIQSARGPVGKLMRATVCADCGLFFVSVNGEHTTFALVSDEQVEAAGKYAEHLKASEQ